MHASRMVEVYIKMEDESGEEEQVELNYEEDSIHTKQCDLATHVKKEELDFEDSNTEQYDRRGDVKTDELILEDVSFQLVDGEVTSKIKMEESDAEADSFLLGEEDLWFNVKTGQLIDPVTTTSPSEIVSKTYECDKCGYKCTLYSVLKEHIMTHTWENLASDKLCLNTLTSGKRWHKSDHCGDDTSNLVNDTRIQVVDGPYSCEQCDFKAKCFSSLIVHMKMHTGEKVYACKECSYKAHTSDDLVRHTRTHAGERPYACNLCDYKGSNAGLLQIHMLTRHTGDNRYKCNKCDYTATFLKSLKKHKKKHSDKKPYACKQCNFKARHPSFLAVHMKTHTGEIPYRCDECDYTTTFINQLEKHVRKHTGDRPHACNVCAYRAYTTSDLIRHARKHTE